MILRPATLGDVTTIHAIECASFGDPWSEASFRTLVTEPRAITLVAVRDDLLVGYAIAWHYEDEAELANIAVAPSALRSGVGGALLDDLLRALDARGVLTVHLEVRAGNVAAQALYSARGFVVSGRRRGYYRNPSEDAILMKRQMGDG